ncbi:MAG: hypothetical protein ABI743_01300 [bacterium]
MSATPSSSRSPRMLDTVLRAWPACDWRVRLLAVLTVIALGVLALPITIPGGVLGLLDIASGGNFRRIAMIALGLMPYLLVGVFVNLLLVLPKGNLMQQKEGNS